MASSCQSEVFLEEGNEVASDSPTITEAICSGVNGAVGRANVPGLSQVADNATTAAPGGTEDIFERIPRRLPNGFLGVDRARQPVDRGLSPLEGSQGKNAGVGGALVSRDLHMGLETSSDSETDGAVRVGRTNQYQCF